MTRRLFSGWTVTSLGASLLGQSRPSLREAVQGYAGTSGLVILSMELTGRTTSGEPAGRLGISSFSGHLAVSPDAELLSWVSRADQGAQIFVMRDRAVVPVNYPGRSVTAIGLSGEGHIHIIAAEGDGQLRLLRLIAGKPDAEDLSSILPRPALSSVEQLSCSNDGRRLAVGSRDYFSVVDLVSGSLLYAASGRFPQLNPNGDLVAFVSPTRTLIVANLGNRTESGPLKGKATDGLGGWSPNGRWLLVGVRDGLLSDRKLAVCDAFDGEAIVLWQIGDDYGSNCHWIRRALLEPL